MTAVERETKARCEAAELRTALWTAVHRLDVAAGYIGMDHKELAETMASAAREGRAALGMGRR